MPPLVSIVGRSRSHRPPCESSGDRDGCDGTHLIQALLVHRPRLVAHLVDQVRRSDQTSTLLPGSTPGLPPCASPRSCRATSTWKLDPLPLLLLQLTHGRFATTLLFPTAVLETKGAERGMRRHNAVPYLNDGTASRSSRRTPERRDTQLVSQPPSGPGLPMWDTIGGMAAPSCIGLSHRLVLARYCDNGPRRGNVTDG